MKGTFEVRSRCLGLLADYRARIRLVYLEVSPADLLRQNREREHAVPEPVIEKLLSRWEVPDLTEAHRVDWVVGTRN